jgi:hypothetical protein
MKTSNTFICLTIVIIVITGCNNQTTERTEETNTNTDTTSQEINTEDTAGQRPAAADTSSKEANVGEEANSFQKSLQFKDITFNVSTKGEGSLRQLFIKPNGLSEKEQNVELEIDGKVTNAQVADLNADGFPEVLVFTQSAGSGGYGNVIAYSVNGGKSMSRVSFPATSENPKVKKGYMGHDNFSVKQSVLIQEFPVYKEGDANSNPTGGVRSVEYKLVDGEASRKFIADKISDSASK